MRVGPVKRAWMVGVGGYLLARNLAFKHAPKAANAMMRLTNVSGRGRGRDGEKALAYFEGVAADYEVIAKTAGLVSDESVFQGKSVLEIGPGNTQAIALLARSKGARRFAGWDAFDVLSRDHRYLDAIYEPLLERAGQPKSNVRELLEGCKIHGSREAFEPPFDLVISRAVLEHVRDVDGLYRDLATLTTSDAAVIHKVDLRSHGHQLTHDLDFLLFSEPAWRGLTTHIGEPNRARYPKYLEIGRQHGFVPIYVASTRVITKAEAERIRPKLAMPYRDMSGDVLSVLGFWLVQVRSGHPLASRVVDTAKLSPAPHNDLAPF